MEMPKAQDDGEKEMERLREVRNSLVELVSVFGWLPYGRFTRCTRPGYMCPRCKENKKRGAHGPYVGLVRCHPNSREKDRVNLGALKEEADGRLMLTGRDIDPTPLTLAGLLAINRLYREDPPPTKEQVISILQETANKERALEAIQYIGRIVSPVSNILVPAPESLEDVVV